MEPQQVVVELITGLVSLEREERGRAADEVTDVFRSFDHDAARAIALLLAAARLIEVDETCQEAQLHALSELDEWDMAPADVLAMLRFLPNDTVPVPQREYLEALLARGRTSGEGPSRVSPR